MTGAFDEVDVGGCSGFDGGGDDGVEEFCDSGGFYFF